VRRRGGVRRDDGAERGSGAGLDSDEIERRGGAGFGERLDLLLGKARPPKLEDGDPRYRPMMNQNPPTA
jgi:hypothetical protein